MREQVEAFMFNGDKKKRKNLMPTAIDPSLMLNEQVYRFEYVTLMNEFVEGLIQKAIKLKAVGTYSRIGALNKFFTTMNQWIEKKVRGKSIELNSKYKKYYRGVMIPLEIEDNSDPVLIVNIVPTLGHCYNTKKRAPYKIAFETIKLYEADLWEKKILKQSEEEIMPFREELKEEIEKEPPFPKERQISNNLFSHKLRLKGLEKFAKLIKAEEKKHKAHNKSLQLSARLQFTETPKRRERSAKRLSEYLRDKFLNRKSTIKPMELRTRNDIKLETVIEKYGRKNSIALKSTDYIPLEDRLEGVPDPFGESWETIVEKTKKSSVYRNFDTYNVRVYIVKGNDDLRQELMAMQFMKRLHEIYLKAGIQIYLRPYEILVTSNDSGIIGILINYYRMRY